MASDWQVGKAQAVRLVGIRKESSWEKFQPLVSSAFIQLVELLKAKSVSFNNQQVVTLTHKVDDTSHDVSICVVVNAKVEGLPSAYEYQELPEKPALVKKFVGSYGPVVAAYYSLPADAEAVGKKLAYPIRTYYLLSPVNGSMDEAKWETEVQAPVQ